MSVDSLGYVLKCISNRTVIKKTIYLYQLRHSYAAHMVDNGYSTWESLHGHEKGETTRVYAYLSGKLGHDLYSKYF